MRFIQDIKKWMKKGDNPSYVKNCLISMREGDDCLFYFDNHMQAYRIQLDGYAIIPMEEYDSLVKCKEDKEDKKDTEDNG